MADEAPPAKSRRPRSFHIVRLLVILVIMASLVAIAIYFARTDHAPAPMQVAAPTEPMPVGVVVVQPRDVPLESRFLAQAEASQRVPIRARVSGYLLERSFEEGQRVEQGQLLFRIDPEPFEVNLAQANAQIAASQARLQRAEQQLERIQRLVTQRAASVDELEQWQEEQQVTSADVQLQQARLAQAELDMGYTRILAPLDGMIGESLQDVGSYISPQGESLLATVWQVDPIYIRYSMSEQEILERERLVSSGAVREAGTEQMKVEAVLPDGRVHPHSGYISFIDVTVDPSTGTAVVKATVPNPEGSLRPGQFITARVTGAQRIGALLVPQAAVMQNPSGTSVYVIDNEGLAQVRLVEPGDWHGKEWIIDSGLQPGDRVIIDHLMQIRPGTPVQPRAAEPLADTASSAPPAPPAPAAPTAPPASEAPADSAAE